ncbi:MAG: C4-dicarboxylate ABC transporter [Candidatus Amoebophilus sp. 36-38]|nr:MAG: C4-dicarboxylate ABC transporter [Candidatus Amoebophilus sp. 36-38]
MIWLEITIVLGAILIGTRLKGISLGIMGGFGLAILAFFFHLKPTDPPSDVLFIITAVVTAAGALEAAGGLGYLAGLAEKTIKKYPHRITFIAPLITYILTFLAGTGHIVYSILPIIATVARDTGVRPERPLTASVIAAQQAAIASPISAPTAILIGILAPYGIELLDVLCILVPATLGGILMTTLVVNRMGKELSEEPAYKKMLEVNEQKDLIKELDTYSKVSNSAKLSVTLFIVGIILIILLGAFKNLRPIWQINGKLVFLDMPTTIEVLMFSIAALTMLTCKLNPTEISKSTVFTSGIQAVISILGISWLGDTFVNANQAQIMELVQTQIVKHPWQFSFILFFMSILLVSQTATIRSLMPLGLALGIPAITLLAASPAVNGLFFFPNYPTILAAINLDRTGTTRVGKFVLNHSFMIPGLIATSTAVIIAFGLVKYLF